MKILRISFFLTLPFLFGLNSPVSAQSGCWTTLDFSRDADGNLLAAGTPIQDQFAGWGLQVKARNNKSGHPHLALVFDSGHPTGGDPDLGTPHESFGGPGRGDGGSSANGANNRALGNLLIIAENNEDGDGDGLIDAPDDEAGGGTLTFRFDRGARIRNLVLVDVDKNEEGAVLMITTLDGVGQEIPISGEGDNSVVRISGEWSDVQLFTISLPGSGAIAELEFCME